MHWRIFRSSDGELMEYALPAVADAFVGGYDMDGDGLADPVVWSPEPGLWSYVTARDTQKNRRIQWGLNGDIPLVADFDGDRRGDLGIYRKATGEWYVLPALNSSYRNAKPFLQGWVKQWGLPNDRIPASLRNLRAIWQDGQR
jgi:hypothetical protein